MVLNQASTVADFGDMLRCNILAADRIVSLIDYLVRLSTIDGKLNQTSFRLVTFTW